MPGSLVGVSERDEPELPVSRTPRLLSNPRPLTSFLRTEAGGAAVLLAATVVALLWSNSPLADGYERLWHLRLRLGAGAWAVTEDLRHWINDGLMTIFFFVVGLEIKRELAVGELQDPRTTALPIGAAAAGMLLPAALYLAVTAGTDATSGWGIPVATDIAFALGVLALFGRGLPAGVKVLLLTIAIADDVGAILVIAVAYSQHLSGGWLAGTVASLALITVVRRLGVTRPSAYLPLAVAAWFATLQSGVHATIAGVALGLMTPAQPVGGRHVLEELEHRLHPISSYLVLPLFALANAGVSLGLPALRAAWTSRVTLAIVAGLVVGKSIGIAGAAWALHRSGAGRLPLGVDLRHAGALAPVAGIGFTVSLFIADLTFASGGRLEEAKIGVLAASLLSGLIGAALLRLVARRAPPERAGDDAAPPTTS
ncbi:MAG TPA: Na+/H+ antiporter NhaA [Nitriliruptorales bacterium]|nr:Na+/H+ antiporter NhaA [Nitriliruptorales bacterium]